MFALVKDGCNDNRENKGMKKEETMRMLYFKPFIILV